MLGASSTGRSYTAGVCERYVHQIDPIIAEVGWVYLWWYGASYTLGLLGAFFWIRRVRNELGYDMRSVFCLTIMLCLGVLLGGRIVEVVFYEWAYYGEHLLHIVAIWLGGMSTHGILLGAVTSVWLFSRLSKKEFLPLADELAIAGAYIMGLGRIGNFIDGQIAGSLTDVCWAVKFPDLEGFRHPVVLYDGIKNLLLVPLLIYIRGQRPPKGVVLAHFVLWYGFLRIFVDIFREYRTELAGFPPGQEFNLLMTLLGIGLLVWIYKFRSDTPETSILDATPAKERNATWLQRASLTILLIIPLVIPSDWTQDVPERYGNRHEGLEHSVIYPRIDNTAYGDETVTPD